ncbi:patellin-4-like [Primulina huaijiensis]|uniref:patellin-4-like n=1 Tax=Primulina huaijiensis TaxID=1492673 RepID=UPI003CC76A8B
MTIDVKAETMEMGEEAVKLVEQVCNEKDRACESKAVEKISSYREESNLPSDLKQHERKALNELKSKLEEAISGNTFFNKEGEKKVSDKPAEEELQEKERPAGESKEGCEEEKNNGDEGTEEKPIECAKTLESDANIEEEKDISIWGVPLLPSKGDDRTDVVLLKFLRARDFKVNDAFQMIEKTLRWRKEYKIDSILDEEFGSDLTSAAYLSGTDRQGHPICYNIFGVLDNEEIYQKTLATEEKREQFLRWRVQLMEKGIQKLNFKPGGVNSFIQINDLKDSPGPSKKEVRSVVSKAVALLQDNYPEFVAKNIFVNVPFWYYALHSLLSPFLTQRSKSKLVFARPSKVTETLLKYVPIQEIPIQYGGMKRGKKIENEVSELLIRAGSTTSFEIPLPEAGTGITWDILALGWEVNCTVEFVPENEKSYTMIIQKERKMCSEEAPVRWTFKNKEPGKIAITIGNASGKKKKVFYSYMLKNSSS